MSSPSPVAPVAIGAVVVLFVATLTAVVVLSVYSPRDNSALIVGIIGAMGTLTAGLLALLHQGQETSSALNGRLTELLESTRGRAQAEERVSGLTAQVQMGQVPVLPQAALPPPGPPSDGPPAEGVGGGV